MDKQLEQSKAVGHSRGLDLSKRIILCLILVILALIVSDWYVESYAENTPRYLRAEIGAVIESGAAVPVNPINKFAFELKQKDEAIVEKEKSVQRQELFFKENIANKQTRILFYLFLVGGILLVLLIINFYLDFRHRRTRGKASV